jgi:ribonuclease P protein component
LILKSIATSFTLGKNERLKSRKLIGQLFKEGKSISSYPLRILYVFPASEHTLQAGFSVGSRSFKKAVDRNRIKRLMREAYRTQKSTFQSFLELNKLHLVLFFIYTGKELPEHELVTKKMNGLLNTLIKNIAESKEKLS